MKHDLRHLLQQALQLQQKGQLREAIQGYDQVLVISPANFDALHLKGLATYQLGKPDEAVHLLTRAIKQKGDFPSAYNNRGLAYQAAGKASLALRDYDRAIGLKPDFAEAHCNRANALRELGRLPDAKAACIEAIRINPNIAEFHNSLGVILKDLKEWQPALASLTTALRLRPNNIEALNNLGNVLGELRRFDEALACLDRAVMVNPGHAQTHANRGNLLQDMGRFDQAAESYRRAISLAPRYVLPWLGLADMASKSGRFDEAVESYEKVLSLERGSVAALSGISQAKKFSEGDPLISEMRQMLSGQGLADEDRARLHHAYGKVCNDLGRYDEAFRQFSIGKGLLKPAFDNEREDARFAALKGVFTSDFLAARKDYGVADERPVFIVGMPRSGTTLTESILSRHHQVAGMGELPLLPRIAYSLGLVEGAPEHFAERLARLQPADVTRLGRDYLDACGSTAATATRIIDKMPHNFQWLGLIALIFPKARIIHCRRNALDNCVSIYMQSYIDQHDYARNLATLGRYYRQYESLMAHWRQVLPVEIHDCVYEDIVQDLEGSARAMVSFLGLPWDAGCLDFNRQESQVNTASLWQVRQPLYDSSVGRWRRYEAHLGALKAALETAT